MRSKVQVNDIVNTQIVMYRYALNEKLEDNDIFFDNDLSVSVREY